MPKYDERNELAPRDVVARAIHAEMRKNNSPCVYLDITKKDADDIAKNFPGIYKELKKRNLDMTKQRIPVRPAAHYLCGGVKTNIDGETSLSDLFGGLKWLARVYTVPTVWPPTRFLKVSYSRDVR